MEIYIYMCVCVYLFIRVIMSIYIYIYVFYARLYIYIYILDRYLYIYRSMEVPVYIYIYTDVHVGVYTTVAAGLQPWTQRVKLIGVVCREHVVVKNTADVNDKTTTAPRWGTVSEPCRWQGGADRALTPKNLGIGIKGPLLRPTLGPDHN